MGSYLPSSTEFLPNLYYLAIYLAAHILVSLPDEIMTVQEILIIRKKIFISKWQHSYRSWSYSVRFWEQLSLVYSPSHPGKAVILQGYFLMEGEGAGCTHTEHFAICLESKSI